MSNEPLQYETPSAARWTKHEVAVLVVKVLAVYCLLQGFQLIVYIPYTLYYVVQGASIVPADAMFWMAPQAIYLGTGVLLWLLSDRAAVYMLGRSRGGVAELPATSELQAAAFSVIGVLLMARGIVYLSQVISGHWAHEDAWISWELRDLRGGLIYSAVQFFLGLFLFVRARGLALFWHKLRTAGVPGKGQDA